MEYSDYVIYVDESGDHSLTSIDEAYPVFALAFCIFKKADYVQVAVPAMQDFKFRWFGHDTVVMHEADIIRRRGPFSFLRYENLRERFMADLAEVIAAMPMTVVSAAIRKDRLKSKYKAPDNPYELGLLFCMERAHDVLCANEAEKPRCHIICESRSPKQAGAGKEDAALELEFRRIVSGDHYLQRLKNKPPMPCFDIIFASKLANSTGLQIADMIARPIGLRAIRPDQENRAFDLIEAKLWKGANGRARLAGLKMFP